MFYIYIHENEKGETLYVGQTIDFRKRLGTHLSYSPWADEIVCAKVIATAETHNEAFILESNYIKQLSPKYNKQVETSAIREVDFLEVSSDKFNEHGLISLADYVELFPSKYAAAKFNGKNSNFFYRFYEREGLAGKRYLDKDGMMYAKSDKGYRHLHQFRGIKPMVAV